MKKAAYVKSSHKHKFWRNLMRGLYIFYPLSNLLLLWEECLAEGVNMPERLDANIKETVELRLLIFQAKVSGETWWGLLFHFHIFLFVEIFRWLHWLRVCSLQRSPLDRVRSDFSDRGSLIFFNSAKNILALFLFGIERIKDSVFLKFFHTLIEFVAIELNIIFLFSHVWELVRNIRFMWALGNHLTLWAMLYNLKVV